MGVSSGQKNIYVCLKKSPEGRKILRSQRSKSLGSFIMRVTVFSATESRARREVCRPLSQMLRAHGDSHAQLSIER